VLLYLAGKTKTPRASDSGGEEREGERERVTFSPTISVQHAPVGGPLSFSKRGAVPAAGTGDKLYIISQQLTI